MSVSRRRVCLAPFVTLLACPTDPPMPSAVGTTASADDDSEDTSGDMPATSATSSGTAPVSSSESSGGPPIEIDLGSNHLPCVDVTTQTLFDFVIPGVEIECMLDEGDGAGAPPNGLELAPTCHVMGAIDEERGGFYAWMVVVNGPSNELRVPFCAPVDVPRGQYDIHVDPGDGSNAVAEPIIGSFAAGTPLSVGTESLTYRISDTRICADTCIFGYTWLVVPGYFDPTTLSVDPANLVTGGFEHGLSISGLAPADGLEAWPWIATIRFDYCLSEAGECDPESDANGGVHVSLLMLPEV